MVQNLPKDQASEQAADVVVVGAGFAGMYALYRLRELGHSVTVVESGPGVGGVWYWNRYPGARCDIPSLEYSYGWSKELYEDWDWSERYARQPEILAYADFVADRFDLRRDIRFETTVLGAEFDEQDELWRVRTSKGRLTARYVLLATGQVSAPNSPTFEGMDSFAGEIHHTSGWPEAGVDFTGRRVGLIGTGSTGIQVLPVVAEQADSVTVFQRTATFAVPMRNHPYTQEGLRDAKKEVLEARELARTSRFGTSFSPVAASALDADPAERQARFQDAWDRGHTASLLLGYGDILVNEEANALAADFMRDRIRETITDPVKGEKLCPRGYPIGAKRPSLEHGFYEAFNRDNVDLVDVRADPVVEVVPKGIRTESGLHELDAIILATGFDTLTGAILRIDIRGRGGVRLRDRWAERPETYLGLGVAGFPNLFLIAGPGSPSLLSNVITSIEHHVDFVGDLLDTVRDRGATVVEVTAEAEREWGAHSAEVAAGTLYTRAESAYMGSNVPGKPRALLPYVGGVGPYRQRCGEVAAAGYEGFEIR